MYTVKLKHVVGLDTIHTVVYTLHETLNLFPDPPSVYGVKGFDTIHTVVYTLHGAQESLH